MCWIKHIKALIFLVFFFSVRSTFILLLVRRDIILCLCAHEILSFSFFSSPHITDTHVWAHISWYWVEIQKKNFSTSPTETSMHCPTCLIAWSPTLLVLLWTTMIHCFPLSWRSLLSFLLYQGAMKSEWERFLACAIFVLDAKDFFLFLESSAK